MSADRLFKVRLKQPFGSDLSMKNTLAIDQNPNDDKNPECDVMYDTAVTPASACTIDQNPDTDDVKNPRCEIAFDTITIIDDDDHNGDNNTSNCTQVAEICTRERNGLKIGCYILNFAEKETLCSKGWLSDLHIN